MATVTIKTPTCIVCRKPGEIVLTEDQYNRLKSGAAIQEALPELTADERELLISGIHPNCWDEMFG